MHIMNAQPPSHLTVRNLPKGLARALVAEKRRRGVSLNQTVIDLLSGALGVTSGVKSTNGLETLAATWNQDEYDAFAGATTAFDAIDEEVWR